MKYNIHVVLSHQLVLGGSAFAKITLIATNISNAIANFKKNNSNFII